MKAAMFITAGTKDKREITSQFVNVKNVDRRLPIKSELAEE